MSKKDEGPGYLDVWGAWFARGPHYHLIRNVLTLSEDDAAAVLEQAKRSGTEPHPPAPAEAGLATETGVAPPSRDHKPPPPAAIKRRTLPPPPG